MAEDKLKALRYQALQNETLKNRDFLEIGGAIYKRHKIDKSAVMEGNLIPLQRGDAFWLIEEIERLRAVVAQQETEIAKVREVMEEYRAALLPFADCYQNEVPESDKALFKNRVLIDVTVADVLRAAMVKRDIEEGLPDSLLDAKPDAAPAPVENAIKVGDLVEVTKEGRFYHLRGHVMETANGRHRIKFLQVEGELTLSWFWFATNELAVLAR